MTKGSQGPHTLLQQAITRDILVAEALAWAERIGVADRLREIHVRPMPRKWASISTRGRLTLNEELLTQPAGFRHEVIVHELVHLKLEHGSHNKLFRTLVKAYLAAWSNAVTQG
ncbi:M48 family metallopeptidase [Kallotenue papyrolyticum]|uniref:M48 metallopeptidase family protein n=1 Tax=Kallotenue papyrolyticum TaxID=1325125 RepID=UPI000492E0A2|nr:M48 family metallopeptidase [Kallotenue papyrolyticum]